MSQTADREKLFRTWDDSFGAIYYKIARSYARSTRDLADLRQEMRFQVWNSTKSFTGTAKPSTWVYRVCLNTALMWRRTALRRSTAIDADVDLEGLPSHHASPSEKLDEQEVINQLYAAIHHLSDADRALILLSLDGLSYRDIADIIGTTENQVGVGLTRARQRLTQHIKKLSHELE